jgi:hypothetical protein
MDQAKELAVCELRVHILDPLVYGHGRREARTVSLGGDDSKCREMRAEPVRHARGGGYILDKYKE